MLPEINLYTDGSSLGNPGPGGYGVILTHKNRRKELSAGFRLTTNNRMELMAVIVGLEEIKVIPSNVTVYTDSKYVADAINKQWLFNWENKNFKKIKNVDLWKRFLNVYRKHNVKFVWIKGHNNHPENERCDKLAVSAANSSNLSVDVEYELQEK